MMMIHQVYVAMVLILMVLILILMVLYLQTYQYNQTDLLYVFYKNLTYAT